MRQQPKHYRSQRNATDLTPGVGRSGRSSCGSTRFRVDRNRLTFAVCHARARAGGWRARMDRVRFDSLWLFPAGRYESQFVEIVT